MPVCGRCYDEDDELYPPNCDEKPELRTDSQYVYLCPECLAELKPGTPHPPMCETCIARQHPNFDREPFDTPEVRAATKAIASLYEYHCVGGYLHLVTDDDNVDCLEACVEYIEQNERGYPPDEIELHWAVVRALRPLDEDHRLSAIAQYHWPHRKRLYR